MLPRASARILRVDSNLTSAAITLRVVLVATGVAALTLILGTLGTIDAEVDAVLACKGARLISRLALATSALFVLTAAIHALVVRNLRASLICLAGLICLLLFAKGLVGYVSFHALERKRNWKDACRPIAGYPRLDSAPSSSCS